MVLGQYPLDNIPRTTYTVSLSINHVLFSSIQHTVTSQKQRQLCMARCHRMKSDLHQDQLRGRSVHERTKFIPIVGAQTKEGVKPSFYNENRFLQHETKQSSVLSFTTSSEFPKIHLIGVGRSRQYYTKVSKAFDATPI